MITQREQRKAAKEFAKRWEGVGYEKGDSARFWMSLLNEVYGVERPAEYIRFEDQVKLDKTSFIDGFIPSTHVLIEQKSINKDLRKAIRQSDGSLLTPFQQAKRYSIELPYDERPRWIVLSNFKEFHIFDMNKPQSEPEIVYLKDLEEDYYRLNFLVDQKDDYVKKSVEVSIQAGTIVGSLYEALLKQYQDPEDEKTLKDLNVLCVRLVFCFYAEDAGLFGKHNMFHDYLDKYSDNPEGFRDVLIKLFKILDQEQHERDPYLSDEILAFPYVNGGLFKNENHVIPRFNEEIIDIILNKAAADFDWSNISPTIFGGLFESTLNPETRRSGGMHYTSIENIHKVIDPLFLDDLKEEFKEAVSLKALNAKNRRLEDLQNKIALLKFLDPAAGSGNFLTETYISLRKLENEILKELLGSQIVMGEIHNPIKVSISQFYGIEINDFAVSVARTALWIAEAQMMKETEDIVNMDLDFFPLKTYPNIVEGNALTINWIEVVGKENLNYIIGNPPFVGGMMMTNSQTEQLKNVMPDMPKVGELDYVTGWFYKASQYMYVNQSVKTAFVSTNSICQGQSVITFWKYLVEKINIKISFAYTTFNWVNEIKGAAAVHCTILGIVHESQEALNRIYQEEKIYKSVSAINPYLTEGANVFITSRSKPLCNVSELKFGSMPRDGGNFILNDEEKQEFISDYPQVSTWIKPYIGAREFINRTNRWVLWLKNVNPSEIRKYPKIVKKVEAVKAFRLSSKAAGTRKYADIPTLFCQIAQPDDGTYIVVPKVSSQMRKYIPIGFMNANTIASDLVFIIPDATIYEFGVLTSNVHMAWMRTVAGRLKSDYRYSKDIVYNNFPWPRVEEEYKNRIVKTATNILKSRELFPDSTYADLYDDTFMPAELRQAHQENDKAVMEAYGFNWRNMNESECVAELMKLYQELVNK